MLKHAFLQFLLFAALFLISCGSNDLDIPGNCSDIECSSEAADDIINRTGWLANGENFDNIPHDISIFDGSENSLPSSVSLESRFPPIGDQGQYGTCVAWAVGYNLKTSLNAIDKGWNSANLSSTANQTSPKDLWLAIDRSKKGANCGGTNFEPALDALISKGAASMSAVPYSNMGNCSGAFTGNAENKLANYRKIAFNNALQGGSGSSGMALDNFKGYLAQGRPVLFGARLGDRFMSWNSASTISSDTYNSPGMQHAYHAMVLVGYDDSKNAFKVRNSWGTSWGSNGSIWVDYDYFLNNFCYVAFVAQNTSLEIEDNEIKDENLLEGYDLLAASAEDWSTGMGRGRVFTYEIYNSGTQTILASQKWTVYYMYYNARNANEYAVIAEDYYTDEFGQPGKYGNYKQYSPAISAATWNNMDVSPGKRVGEEYFPNGFQISYTMPSITGEYYLLVYADANNAIKEENEDNNFYYITAEGGKPLSFRNGIMQNRPVSASNALAKAAGEAKQKLPANAYTNAEIKNLILRHKKKAGK